MNVRDWHITWFLPFVIILAVANCWAFVVSGNLLNLFAAGLLTYVISKNWSMMVKRRPKHGE